VYAVNLLLSKCAVSRGLAGIIGFRCTLQCLFLPAGHGRSKIAENGNGLAAGKIDHINHNKNMDHSQSTKMQQGEVVAMTSAGINPLLKPAKVG
jgi:hypothetical protein